MTQRSQADRLGASGQRRRRRRGDTSSAPLVHPSTRRRRLPPSRHKPEYTSASAQFVAALFLVLALCILVLRVRVSALRLRVSSIAGDETGSNGRSFVGTGRASCVSSLPLPLLPDLMSLRSRRPTGARTTAPTPAPLSFVKDRRRRLKMDVRAPSFPSLSLPDLISCRPS
jgi:hypothetical protein